MKFIPYLAGGWVVALLSGCQPLASASANGEAATVANTLTLVVDGHSQTLSSAPADEVVTAGIIGGSGHFSLSGMSKSKDVSFAIICRTGPLRAGGTYAVYTCLRPTSRCDNEEREHAGSEGAVITSYPTGTPPAGELAYNAPELGLRPLTLRIESVTDENVPGVGPTKRVKGAFEGTLADVEGIPGTHDYRVVKRVAVAGVFNSWCVTR